MKAMTLAAVFTMTACGGEVEMSSVQQNIAVDAGATCETGQVECAGPVEPCGRRMRTCNDDGGWGGWTCAAPVGCE